MVPLRIPLPEPLHVRRDSHTFFLQKNSKKQLTLPRSSPLVRHLAVREDRALGAVRVDVLDRPVGVAHHFPAVRVVAFDLAVGEVVDLDELPVLEHLRKQSSHITVVVDSDATRDSLQVTVVEADVGGSVWKNELRRPVRETDEPRAVREPLFDAVRPPVLGGGREGVWTGKSFQIVVEDAEERFRGRERWFSGSGGRFGVLGRVLVDL